MSGRRMSARGASMSRAAKQHLKRKKRRNKLGLRENEPARSEKGFWLLVVAVLIVIGFVVARVFR